MKTAAGRMLMLLLAAVLAACEGLPPRTPDADAVVAARAAGERAYAAGEWQAAAPHYSVLVEALPQDAELWFRLGNIYARTAQPDAAVAAYREALVRDSTLAKAWFNMGVVQLRQAANSFLKLDVHGAPGDPMAEQGAQAYAAIMAILGQHGGTPAAAPAADDAPVAE